MSESFELLSSLSSDVQAARPATEVSLTRVGVRGVEKVIRVGGGIGGNGRPTAGDHYFAEIECFVDLDPTQAGVHMSRFEEVVNEAIDSIVLGESLRAEGFGDEDIERVMDAVPVATHNQRGIGSLHIGRPEGVAIDVDARDLLHIVERSMSSEIYELMKRSDEVAVVERAHRRPRFVEDCVREMVRHVAERYPELAEGGFVLARQENLETIHRHSVVAERSGLLAEILAELSSGNRSAHHMTE